MATIRAALPQRLFALSIALALPLTLTACDRIFGDDEPVTETDVIASISHGACLPTLADEVFDADMSSTGSRILAISGEKPGTLSEEANWSSTDRALMVADLDEDGNGTSRHIALSWAATDSIAPFATQDPGAGSLQPIDLPEDMEAVELDDSGGRFVVAARRRGQQGPYDKLYWGDVPADGTSNLAPGEGLSIVEINALGANEGIQNFWLSPDGERVAAVVGSLGELRVYDLGAETNPLYVYALDQDGNVEVSHDMPDPMLSLDSRHVPAVASNGTIRTTWSPDSSRLAVVRGVGLQVVGGSVIEILDVGSGQLTEVRDFQYSSAPHVAWSDDGNSLWVLNTFTAGAEGDTSNAGSIFGDVELQRIEAAAGGEELDPGARFPRQQGWVTDPGNLSVYDDDSLVLTWEDRLFRVDLENGGRGGAEIHQLLFDQRVPSEMRVISNRAPVGAAERDLIMFLLSDRAGMHVGLRKYAGLPGGEYCPDDEVEIPEEEAAEGEGEGDAGTEGDSAEGEGAENASGQEEGSEESSGSDG